MIIRAGSELSGSIAGAELMRGTVSDIVGVEMGRANKGEPALTKYCGPLGKFVSWPEAIPSADITNRTQQKKTLIEPSALRSCAAHYDAE